VFSGESLSHELFNSYMLYIHPPLAIIGYIFIFLFAFSLLSAKNYEKKAVKYFGISAWIFTFLGLVTGMLWAQIAWGSYWSWDPKETLTLILFLTVTASEIAYFEKKSKLTQWVSLSSCPIAIITLLISFIIAGLHSFA
jgi:ABC-type transport system involved in cytochrome c biogenesis permease subunit